MAPGNYTALCKLSLSNSYSGIILLDIHKITIMKIHAWEKNLKLCPILVSPVKSYFLNSLILLSASRQEVAGMRSASHRVSTKVLFPS